MKFQVDKTEMSNAVGLVMGVVSNRATLPILSNILISTLGKNKLSIVGTDLEVGMSKTIEAQISEAGEVTIPARKLNDIVKELGGGTIEFDVSKSNTMTIKSGKSLFKIVGLPKDDFPNLPEFSLKEAVELDQKTLKEGLELTSFAISRDETRYVLNGIMFSLKGGNLKIVATDGRRLAVFKKKLTLSQGTSMEVIIPTKTVYELTRMLDEEGKVKIVLSKNQIIFHFDDKYIISRLVDGHYPNYEQVIPKQETSLVNVNKEKLLSAIRRASILTSPEAQAVKFDVFKDKVTISSRSPNLGEAREEVESKTKGKDVVIGFNPTYLADVLKVIEEDEVAISLSDADKPGMLKGKDGYIYVVMPMQLG